MRPQNANLPSLISGVAIIVVGLALLLDQTGVIQIRELLRYWPGILIGIGAWKLTEADTFNKLLGADMIVLGALFMAHQLHYLRVRPPLVIGVVIVLAGLFLVAKALDPERVATGELNAGMLRGFAIFGGTEERFAATDFQGGDLTAIFGGLEIDLSRSSMAGNRADLYISCMFGGVELVVPADWQVVAQVGAIFGGVENKSRDREIKEEAPKILYVKGLVMFGGVEIKS